jgi:nucleoredoxin
MNRLFSIIAACAFVSTAPGVFAEEAGSLAFLPGTLSNAAGEEVPTSSLEGKYVALYFSASWCPPCRSFTPKLVKFRDENADEDFEVVFISFDESAESKSNYMKQAGMKWLTLPGFNDAAGNELALKYQIQGLPTLVVLSPDGKVVAPNGRQDVIFNPRKALKKWKSAKQS